jgi:4-amino-4-deoxy-L-arabinose transferase-like glycosyltransferase
MRSLAPIVLGALALRLAILAVRHDAPIDMEGANYARLAQNLHGGLGYVSIRGTVGTEYAPFYPLTIAATLPIVPNAQFAGELIAVLFGALLVAAVWLLCAEIANPRVATVAALLIAVAPVLVTLSTSVLTETPFAALLVLGLWLFLRTLRTGRTSDAAGAGAAFALAFLTRAEGAAFVLFAGLVLTAAALRRPGSLRPFAAFAAVTALFVLPFVWFTYHTSGHVLFDGKSRINAVEAAGLRAGHSYLAVADAVTADGRPIGPEIDLAYHDPRGDAPAPSMRDRAVMALGAELRHVRDLGYAFKGSDFGSWPLVALALLGFIASMRTRERRLANTVILASVATLYLALGSVWHFWERYAAVFLVFAIVYASQGVEAAREWSRSRRVPDVGTFMVAAVIVLSLAVVAREALARVEAPERAVGAWIASHGNDVLVIDASNLAAYYGGATWLPLPYAPEGPSRAFLNRTCPDYVVLDTRRRNDYPLLARWFDSAPPAADAELVFTAAGIEGSLRLFRYRAGAHRGSIATRAVTPGAACVRRPGLERSLQRARARERTNFLAQSQSPGAKDRSEPSTSR